MAKDTFDKLTKDLISTEIIHSVMKFKRLKEKHSNLYIKKTKQNHWFTRPKNHPL